MASRGQTERLVLAAEGRATFMNVVPPAADMGKSTRNAIAVAICKGIMAEFPLTPEHGMQRDCWK